MRKIFQERINISELESSKGTLFLPKYLEIWNKNGIKTINGILKRITGIDNIKVTFGNDTTFTLKADKCYTGSLEYGDMDEMPKIKLTSGDLTTIYEVLNITDDNKTLINLDSEITKRDDKVLTQMFYKNIAFFHIRMDDIVYRITVYSPLEKDEVFTLPYESDLKETLFSFNSNTSINEIVKALEYYLGRLDKFPKVEITRSIEERRKFPKTTDEFVLKSGSLDKFMQTKKVGSKNYVVRIEDNKISYNIENLSFNDIVEPDKELVTQGMQYVKRYPKM